MHQRDVAFQDLCEIREAINADQDESTVNEVRRVVALRAELLSELRAAHNIIKNALCVMTVEQKTEWGRMNERDSVAGEGITRANERLAAIHKAEGRS